MGEPGWYIVVCPHCGTNVQVSKEDDPTTGGIQIWRHVAGVLVLAVVVVAIIVKIDRLLVPPHGPLAMRPTAPPGHRPPTTSVLTTNRK